MLAGLRKRRGFSLADACGLPRARSGAGVGCIRFCGSLVSYTASLQLGNCAAQLLWGHKAAPISGNGSVLAADPLCDTGGNGSYAQPHQLSDCESTP